MSVKITVVGSGYVGLVAAACFAELGHSVICVDQLRERIDLLNAGECPLHEKFLLELLGRHQGGNLRFTTALKEAVRKSEVVFIAVGTPSTSSGEADLSYVGAVVREIALAIGGYTVVVEKSTVPVCTNEWVERVLLRNGVRREDFDVASNPEFLREGAAVSDFLHPDRIVVGTHSERAAALLAAVYRPLTSGEYYWKEDAVAGARRPATPPVLMQTSAESAELIKHASNAFLAMKISFINMVANLCETVNADIMEVARGIGADARIGSQFLHPGLGYGGSCLPKDVKAFCAAAQWAGLEFRLLAEVERINEQQRQLFVKKIRTTLWTLKGKKIAVLGLAFKGDTDDVRESPAIEIVRDLLQQDCTIMAYDPAAMERAREVLPETPALTFASDAYAAASGADALIVLTEWKEFAELNLARLKAELLYPIVIDGRNLFDPMLMNEHGFTYVSMGRAEVRPAEVALKRRA